MTEPRPVRLGALGKVPAHNEYVRLHASEPPMVALDSFLTENMEWAARRAGPSWPEAYGRGAIQAFVFRPRDSARVVAGAIAPSMDGAGRRFPVCIVTSGAPEGGFAEFASSPESLPLALEEFWQLGSQILVETAADGGAHLGERLTAALDPPPAVDEAVECYTDWASSAALSELGSLLYGAPHEVELPEAIRFIREAIRPHCGVERADTPLSFRLPLGLLGGAAVCFWIDVVRRISGWKGTIPSFFWSHDGRGGDLLLHLGNPPKCTLAELWMPSGNQDEFCDLSSTPPSARTTGLPALPAPLASLRTSSRASALDLLDALSETASP